MGAVRFAGRLIGPVARKQGPQLAAGFVRQAFDRAVDGIGPLRGAAAAAEDMLAESQGNTDRAIGALIDSHVKLAGIQGFVTNLGGLVTMTITVPANISGLALLQCHLVGGIAHLRGYDLHDPRVRNAVLACMLGHEAVQTLIQRRRLPSSPMAIATAPAHASDLDRSIAAEVGAELLGRAAGKRTVTMIGRRMPLVGGGVGAVADGVATYRVGQYARRELRSRHRRTSD